MFLLITGIIGLLLAASFALLWLYALVKAGYWWIVLLVFVWLGGLYHDTSMMDGRSKSTDAARTEPATPAQCSTVPVGG